MSPRSFPRRVAVFDDNFLFTTLTLNDVASHSRVPFCHPKTGLACRLFTLDKELCYTSFAQDHGPFNLAYTVHACEKIHERLHKTETRPLCLYSTVEPKQKSNMILIVALYYLIVANQEPWEAFKPVAEMEVRPFRDAGSGPMDHGISVLDCLYGVARAIDLKLLDFVNLDLRFYTYYERVENGDLNVLGPFIAFASPDDGRWVKRKHESTSTTPARNAPQHSAHALKCVLKVFEQEEVGLVVRLNDELYDKRRFLDRGINHVDMYFDDGSNPSDGLVREFIRLADATIEGQGRKVAVHCKAGLGRTGVLIGAYLIYKHQFSAQEVIAYMRIVRPGMVVGPQQQYMHLNQMKWVQWAARDEVQKELEAATDYPTNPLATPPTELDLPLLPSSLRLSQAPEQSVLEDLTLKLQSKEISRPSSRTHTPNRPAVRKGGDAVGQPRKSPVRSVRGESYTESTVTPSASVAVELPRTVPRAVLREPSFTENTDKPSAATGSMRGVKRTSTRLPIPQIPPQQASRTTRLVVPTFDRPTLERSTSSSSILSTADSESGRPHKRRPTGPSSSPLGKTGLSSPPPTRETTPADDVNMSEVSGTTITRTQSRVKQRTPSVEPMILSTPQPTAPPSSPPSSTTPTTKRGFIPRLMSREKSMERIPQIKEEVMAERSRFSKALTPPRFARELFRVG